MQAVNQVNFTCLILMDDVGDGVWVLLRGAQSPLRSLHFQSKGSHVTKYWKEGALNCEICEGSHFSGIP